MGAWCSDTRIRRLNANVGVGYSYAVVLGDLGMGVEEVTPQDRRMILIASVAFAVAALCVALEHWHP